MYLSRTITVPTARHPLPLLPAITSPSLSPQSAGPSPAEASGSLCLSTFCGQLLSQALSCLYVRHWAVLVAAARLGEAVCRLGRRTVPARLWTRPAGQEEQRAQQALMKALKVRWEGGGASGEEEWKKDGIGVVWKWTPVS